MQYYCNSIGQYTTPLDLPFVCHTPYNIGDGNIVMMMMFTPERHLPTSGQHGPAPSGTPPPAQPPPPPQTRETQSHSAPTPLKRPGLRSLRLKLLRRRRTRDIVGAPTAFLSSRRGSAERRRAASASPASCAVLPCKDCKRAVLVLCAPTALRRLRWTRSWTWRRVLRSHGS